VAAIIGQCWGGPFVWGGVAAIIGQCWGGPFVWGGEGAVRWYVVAWWEGHTAAVTRMCGQGFGLVVIVERVWLQLWGAVQCRAYVDRGVSVAVGFALAIVIVVRVWRQLQSSVQGFLCSCDRVTSVCVCVYVCLVYGCDCGRKYDGVEEADCLPLPPALMYVSLTQNHMYLCLAITTVLIIIISYDCFR